MANYSVGKFMVLFKNKLYIFIFDSPMGNVIEDEICAKALLQRYGYWYKIKYVNVCKSMQKYVEETAAFLA